MRPGFSISSLDLAADSDGALKAGLLPSSSACRRARRSSLTVFGHLIRQASAAGVPGRGVYLKEKAWAIADASRDQRQRRLEVRVGLAGEADDEIARTARCPGRARAARSTSCR